MKARYIRISTPDQNKERQLVKQHPGEKLFIDVCSGSIPFAERAKGRALIDMLNNGSLILSVSVHAVDRLGRNLVDILNTLQYFEDSGVSVKVDNLGIESMVKGRPNAAFKLIISVLANIAEMERATMLERQKEGIAAARAKDAALPPEQRTYKGRIRGSTDSKDVILARYPKVVKEIKAGAISQRKIAKLCGASLSTVQKVKKLIHA